MAYRNWYIYTSGYDGARGIAAQCANKDCYKSKKRVAQQQMFLIGHFDDQNIPNCTVCKQPIIDAEAIPEVLAEYHTS